MGQGVSRVRVPGVEVRVRVEVRVHVCCDVRVEQGVCVCVWRS